MWQRSGRGCLPATVALKEEADFPSQILVLGRHPTEATMGHGLKDVQSGFNPGSAQLAMHSDRVREEQSASAGLKESRRETGDLPEQRRQVGVGEIVPVCVEQVDLHQRGQDRVESEKGVEGITRFREVNLRSDQDEGGWHWEPFILGSQKKRRSEIATRRPASD